MSRFHGLFNHAQGYYCSVVRSPEFRVIRCCGLKWVSSCSWAQCLGRQLPSAVGPRLWPNPTGLAGPVFDRDRADSATELCGSYAGADDRMVSPRQSNLCRLLHLGVSTLLAYPAFREPRCGAQVRAICFDRI